MLLQPGRGNRQTFLIDPLCGSELSDCIRDCLMTELIPAERRNTRCAVELPQHYFPAIFSSITAGRTRAADWERRGAEQASRYARGGTEGHDNPHSVAESGRPRVRRDSEIPQICLPAPLLCGSCLKFLFDSPVAR